MLDYVVRCIPGTYFYLITESLCLLTVFLQFPLPQTPSSGDHKSDLFFGTFVDLQHYISSCSVSAIRVVSSAYLRLLIFLPAILIPTCDSSSVAFHMMHAAAAAKSLQSCLTLCDPVDCSPPGSSVHGIHQARMLEWVAISFSRGSSQPRN